MNDPLQLYIPGLEFYVYLEVYEKPMTDFKQGSEKSRLN